MVKKNIKYFIFIYLFVLTILNKSNTICALENNNRYDHYHQISKNVSKVSNNESCDNTLKVIKGRNVVIDGKVKPATILIRNGIIIDIKEFDYKIKEKHETLALVDDDLVVMGGLVDSHVHVNEPGRTEWEGFVSATSAAAAGGVTTIVDMPLNSIPVTTSFKNLQDKIESMKGKLRVDVALLGGIIPGNSNEIYEMVLRGGVVGFKSFLLPSGIDEFPPVQQYDIEHAMNVMKILSKQYGGRDVIMMFHAEMDDPIQEATKLLIAQHADPKLYTTFLSSRPRVSENLAIEKVIELCKLNNVRTHIVHLSSSDAIDSIAEAIQQGVPISAETTYNYLYFISEKVPYGNTLFKSCPPVREQENKDLLWNAVINGTIGIIVSDHSPCTLDLKLIEQGDFLKAWGGISSLELGLPIIWTEAKKRGIHYSMLSEYMSNGPAKLVGLNDRKGSIAISRDADFVIWNPNESFIVDQNKLMIKNKYSAYHGENLTGVVYQTILRGQTIFKKGDQQISKIIGTRLVATKIHTNSKFYPNPTLPSIQIFNNLKLPFTILNNGVGDATDLHTYDDTFLNCIQLLFNFNSTLTYKFISNQFIYDLYNHRPYSSYQQVLDRANLIINNNLSINDKINFINFIKINNYQSQQHHHNNQKYKSKFGFQFIEQNNNHIEKRLNNSLNVEINNTINEIINNSKLRILNLTQSSN